MNKRILIIAALIASIATPALSAGGTTVDWCKQKGGKWVSGKCVTR